MKGSNKMFCGLCAVVLMLLMSFGCQDLTESDLAEPYTYLPSDIETLDIGDDFPQQADNPKDQGFLHIKILVSECPKDRANRPYKLKAINPRSSASNYYNAARFRVRWYASDGRMISDSPDLGCVAGGVFRVEISDSVSNGYGFKEISL